MLLALPALLSSACAHAFNYREAHGPRFAGSYAPLNVSASPGGSFNVVTFNIKFARRIDLALQLLASSSELALADVILLQEMDARGTEALAARLGMNYVYYPAAVHPQTHRDFGNAILSRWPIRHDQKLALPHRSFLDGSQRIATCATLTTGVRPVDVCSTHLATPVELLPGARREQVGRLLSHLMGTPCAIIGGDFNSHDLGSLVSANSFEWPTRDIGPTTRYFSVDHIFARGLRATQVGKVTDTLGASDHAAVWTKLTWN
jgi:endonuclease/exonuclease/phosphatase family metal-dependent hydrolase